MTVYTKRKRFTVEEYYKLAEVGILQPEDRVELINGDIITMSLIKSPHAGMVNRLTKLLMKALSEKASIAPQNPIRLDDSSEPEPDIIIAHFREDDYFEQHPTPKDIYFLIEVADTSLEKDRQIKAPLYAEANIPEYWIINIEERQVEIYRQPKNGEYHFKQIISETAIIKASTIDFEVSYSDVFK